MMTRLVLAAGLAAAIVAGPTGSANAAEQPFELSTALDRSILKAGESQRIYLRIGMKAVRPAGSRPRTPMNLALVIDRSGSMAGPRIEGARAAAMMAVDRLAANDIVSVVSYDDRVEVEVPATKATDPAAIKERIRRLTPRGSTAIHAGLLAGAAEIRKFKSRDRVNRIILLSDGLANVGPSRPEDFASLGRELASEGMTVSTVGLGLGYNEDLMAKLAQNADGTHAFVQEPADLAQFFSREFDEAVGILAQEIEIIITCAPGVKPMRSLGRDARIENGRIIYKVGQIAGGSEQVLLAELEAPAGIAGSERDVVSVDVAYRDMASGTSRQDRAAVKARYAEAAASDASVDPQVQGDVTVLVAREQRQEAIRLRDAGRAEEAKRKFDSNAAFIQDKQRQLPATVQGYAPLLRELEANRAAAAPAASDPAGWAKARKLQREADTNSAGSAQKY